jgi:hypothetical protein
MMLGRNWPEISTSTISSKIVEFRIEIFRLKMTINKTNSFTTRQYTYAYHG